MNLDDVQQDSALAIIAERDQLRTDLAAARAEVERLRTGLEEISATLPCEVPCISRRDHCTGCGRTHELYECAGCIARRYLAAAEEEIDG